MKMKLKKSKSDVVLDIVIYAVMFFVIIVTLYPFLNVLAVSLNDSTDTLRGSNFIIPRHFTWLNYLKLARYPNLTHAFYISVVRAVVGTVTCVIASSMVAYTLSRREYVFRRFVSVLFVTTMYVSGGLIPAYMLIRNLHMIGTFWVYILPSLVGAFNVIVMRSFMDQLPYSLQESASIEGANDFMIYYKIIMPLCMPAIAFVALLVAVGPWNSWFDTYLYNNAKPELSTLQYELMKVLQSTTAGNAMSLAYANANAAVQDLNNITPQTTRMTITVVATVPILLVYPFLQKYFVTGATIGAVKG